MNKVTHSDWLKKSRNFQARIKENPYPENIEWYRNILSKVTIGKSVLDVGAGDCHVGKAIPNDVEYFCIDPFPRNGYTIKLTAEELVGFEPKCFETVVCLASLDNCQDLHMALHGIRHVSEKNIVIYTGIGIEPDDLHTLKITRKDLTDVLGEPVKEIEVSPKVFLLEFTA